MSIIESPGIDINEIDQSSYTPLYNSPRNSVKGEVSKAAIQSAIANALVLIGATVTGIEVGQVAAGAKVTYQAAIDTAEIIEADVTAITGEVSDAVGTLAIATGVFEDAIVVEVSKTALQGAIEDALELLANTPTGEGAGDVSDGAKVTYQAAIDAAEVVEEDIGATTVEVSGAVSTLGIATGVFEGAILQ